MKSIRNQVWCQNWNYIDKKVKDSVVSKIENKIEVQIWNKVLEFELQIERSIMNEMYEAN